jgi:hypothetical protein
MGLVAKLVIEVILPLRHWLSHDKYHQFCAVYFIPAWHNSADHIINAKHTEKLLLPSS